MKIRLYIAKMFLLLAVFGLSEIAFGQNYVHAPGEHTIHSDISLTTSTSWGTDRGAAPGQQGFFSAVGTARYLGANDTYNINGYVKHYANEQNQNYTFPVGTGTDLRELSMGGALPADGVVAVAWIAGNPSTTNDPTDPAMHNITLHEQNILEVIKEGQWDWKVFEQSFSGAVVSGKIPVLTGYNYKPAQLRLVGWDGSIWVNLSGNRRVTSLSENTFVSGIMRDGITAVTLGFVPTITLVKTATKVDVDGDGKILDGDYINYTFLVKNESTVDLKDIEMKDPMLEGAGIAMPQIPDLAVDGDFTFGLTYTITQADVDAGVVINSATVRAFDAVGHWATDISGTTGNTDSPTVVFLYNPDISLVKKAAVSDTDGDGLIDKDDKITYTFVVTNEGNVALENITMTDPMLEVAGVAMPPIQNLAVSGTYTFDVDYTITQSDVDAGVVTNTAVVYADDIVGHQVSDTSGTSSATDDPTVVELDIPAVSLVKSGELYDADGDGEIVSGDQINYTFVITNEGTVSLTNIRVSDAMLAGSLPDLSTLSLPVSKTHSFTVSYTITDSDVSEGVVTNTAVVYADDIVGHQVSDTSGTSRATDDSTVVELDISAVSLVKSGELYDVDGDGEIASGDQINYTFVITNEGTVSLTNIRVSDAMLAGSLPDLSTLSLPVSKTHSFTVSYTITDSDVSEGVVTNTAVVYADDFRGQSVSDISGTSRKTDDPTVVLLNLHVVNSTLAVDDINDTFVNTSAVGNVLTNDKDFEGDIQKVTSHTQPSHGRVEVLTDGSYTYTPDKDFTGTDSFRYTLCDNGIPQACDEAEVTIKVLSENTLGGNATPVANSDVAFTKMNIIVSGNLLSNDYDPDEGDELTLNLIPIEGPSHGSVSINSDGTYSYTPALGFIGEDSFTYEICDNGDPVRCDRATVTIYVLPDNDINDTYASDDVFTSQMNIPIAGNVLSNDTDPEGDMQIVNSVAVKAPAHGSLDLNEDGTFTYTPDNDYVGFDSFVYEVCDSGTPKACARATVLLMINSTNTKNSTLAVNDINSTYVNTSVSGNVLTNDKDFEGDIQKVTSYTQPSHGRVEVLADGSYTYTPDKDFTGTDSFSYTLCDNGIPQACDEAEVTIKVLLENTLGENATPVANNDVAFTKMNMIVSGNLLLNDYDPDEGDELTLNPVPIEGPSHGAVSINLDGTYTYTPDSGFVGEDSFTYEICDNGDPVRCDRATVTIYVLPDNGINDTYASDDFFSGRMNVPIVGNVLSNDTDLEGDMQIVNSVVVKAPAHGSLDLNEDGTFTYTPNDDYVGFDSFVYEVCDSGSPQACARATVNLLIQESKKEGAISLVKIGSHDKATNTVFYIFRVKNTGQLPLHSISITDAKIVSTIPESVPILSVGDSTVFRANYTPTEHELSAGIVTNTAIVSAIDSNNNSVKDISGTAEDNDLPTTTPLPGSPGISLVKTVIAPEEIKVGEYLTYVFRVDNIGNVPLENIQILDEKIETPLSNVALLLAGSSVTLTAIYELTQSDIDSGVVTNTAEVVATTFAGVKVSDVSDNNTPDEDEDGDGDSGNDPTHIEFVNHPAIALSKTSDKNEVGTLGEVVRYTITVANTGNVTLYDVTVEDAKTGFIEVIPELNVGVSEELITDYEVRGEDLVEGKTIVNVATVVGKTLQGDKVTATAENTIKFFCLQFKEDFEVPQILTMNNDSYNSTLEISGLIYCKVCNLSNKLMIFNRWGALVYEKENYMGDEERFDGHSKSSSYIFQNNKKLPVGVYFWIIQVEGKTDKTGYLYILVE